MKTIVSIVLVCVSLASCGRYRIPLDWRAEQSLEHVILVVSGAEAPEVDEGGFMSQSEKADAMMQDRLVRAGLVPTTIARGRAIYQLQKVRWYKGYWPETPPKLARSFTQVDWPDEICSIAAKSGAHAVLWIDVEVAFKEGTSDIEYINTQSAETHLKLWGDLITCPRKEVIWRNVVQRRFPLHTSELSEGESAWEKFLGEDPSEIRRLMIATTKY